MFPPPTGPVPNVEQVRELDDSFFASDPFGYFRARIESLIVHAQGAQVDYGTALGDDYRRRLGAEVQHLANTSADARELQVVVDALSLRQHAAEALIRLWLAVLQTRTAPPGAVSLWATVADGETSMMKVLKAIAKTDGATDPRVVLALLLPHDVVPAFGMNEQLQQAVAVAEEWLVHAEKLLTRADLSFSGAHNKAKHGLAVRARADLRLDAVFEMPPHDEGTLPVSAMDGAIPIFDRPVLEYLLRPPRGGKGPQGLELVQLRLDAASLLVESTMLATVHAAVFHVAAARHAAWSTTVGTIPPYPTLPLGPTPAQLLGKAVTGMRFPVTDRPDGTPTTRPSGIGFNHGAFVPLVFDHEAHERVTLVDDGPVMRPLPTEGPHPEDDFREGRAP